MFFNVLFYMGKLRTVCVCSAKNVLSEDIAVILLCTAPYLHPKSSHTLYVQYKRVSTMFFNAIIYFLQVYFTWEKCVQCALHCRECALKDECFIRRYRSDPAMYSTLPAPKKQLCTLCSKQKSYKHVFQRFILHGNSAYCVGLHCRECALKDGCFNRRQFQACFSKYYFTWEECVQCAFALQRMRVERRVFFGR